jgi:hypothetical protein
MMAARHEHHDEDLRREAVDERRARSMSISCVCGNDLPGRCPGRLNCPYSGQQAEPDEVECKVCGGDGYEYWSETYRTHDGRTVDDFGSIPCQSCGGTGVIQW